MKYWLALALAAWGCSGDDGGGEAASDAAAMAGDARPADAGARPRDGAADAGAGDAQPPDAQPVDAANGTPADATPADAAQTCLASGVIELETEDGETLVGDLYPAPGTGRGAVLLHMIPPSNTRANYPPAFIDALVERGFTVLNVDRRGAGDSTGVAREAYEGPQGRLDVVAARGALVGSGCGVEDVAIIGASNGTTSALDYAVAAAPDDRPSALVFLTGGGYTENQNAIDAHRATLDALPVLFVFSTAERAWSAGHQADPSPNWSFQEYADGAHGTRMFGAQPRSVEAVADWLDEVVD